MVLQEFLERRDKAQRGQTCTDMQFDIEEKKLY